MVQNKNAETAPSPSSQEKQPVLHPHDRLAQSEHYVRAMSTARVLRSREFALAHNSAQSGVQAFSEASLALAQSPEDIDDFDRSLLTIVGRLGTFLDAQKELHTLNDLRSFEKARHSDISEDDVAYMKELKQEYMLPFNHAIKDIIIDYPTLNINDLRDNLAFAYIAIYGRHNTLHPEQPQREMSRTPAHDVLFDIETVINGMRHEVAAETMFTAAGVNYNYEVTDEQDQRGRDIFAEIDGRWIGIDIKSTLNAERRAHERRNSARGVWTGLSSEDFQGIKGRSPGSVSISFETAKQLAPAFIDRIRQMKSGALGRQHRAALHTGSRALSYSRT